MVSTRSREESIVLRGVRTHNLRGVDVDIRLGAVTAVVGVSGSGKSSLAVETLAAEGLRRHLFLHDPARSGVALPIAADLIENLPPTYCFTGARSDNAARSTTVAAYLGLWQILVSLLVREGKVRSPATGEPVYAMTPAQMVERALELDASERLMVLAPFDLEAQRLEKQLDAARAAGFVRVRIDGEVLRLDDPQTFARGEEAKNAELVIDRVRGAKSQRWAESIELALKWNAQVVRIVGVDTDLTLRRNAVCPVSGWRAPKVEERLFSISSKGCLHDLAEAVFLWGKSSRSLLNMSADELRSWIASISAPDAVSQILLTSLANRLSKMCELDLGRTILAAPLESLSSGQRNLLAMGRARAAELRGALLVLDELSTGVHPDNHPALLAALRELAEDNTVVLVEHLPAFIERADEVIEIGPGAGEEGGNIVFCGSQADFRLQSTATAQSLKTAHHTVPTTKAKQASQVRVELGELVGLRSVGIEKSRLLEEVLAPRFENDASVSRVVRMEDRLIVRSARSIAATILGVMDPLRALFAALPEARVRGYKSSRFSFNVREGRCQACEGTGLAFAQDAEASLFAPSCPVCQGARYAPETREVRYRGHDISELLNLSLDDAERLLSAHPKVAPPLAGARSLGVGYLSLGRPAQTLSNGELQRLWLAKELSKRGKGKLVYLFDEPTSGLHPVDAERFVAAVVTLASAGHAVVVASVDNVLLSRCHRVYDCDNMGI